MLGIDVICLASSNIKHVNYTKIYNKFMNHLK